MTPLLSICIPTFNRAEFLRVMLGALLPQAARCGGEVEVIVLDNGSSDDTAAVLSDAQALGVFRILRHPANLGPLANVVLGPRDFATGEYSWILGDHNLMRPGGLARVMQMLKAQPGKDIFYVNFRCASYPEQWPESAPGGHEGPFAYIGNPLLSGEEVSEWSGLLDGKSAFGTQAYAHIVRTGTWREFWRGQPVDVAYRSGMTTYPHTWMIASCHFDSPAGVAAEPVLTIFNGAQSWGDVRTRAKVYLKGLPDLIRLFREKGLPAERVRRAEDFVHGAVRDMAKDIVSRKVPGFGALALLGCAGTRNRRLWRAVLDGWYLAQASVPARVLKAAADRSRRIWTYCARDCRPARWLRGCARP